MDLLPSDPTSCTAAREAAEHAGDDEQLLSLRELELAFRDLPPVIDGARRTRLLWTDSISTTWEGWDLDDGHRLVMRCLRPRWRNDPVMRRRMARAIERAPRNVTDTGLQVPSWHPDGDWPHLRVDVHGSLLIDRFPVEDLPGTALQARVLGGGLQALDALHRSGRVHGGPIAHQLVERTTGIDLLWLDPFSTTTSVQDDLTELASAVADLDPARSDGVSALAESWAVVPPPTAADALGLLQRALAGQLLEARHRLAVAGRHTDRRGRAARLSRLLRRLESVVTPPVGRVCLRAGHDAVAVMATSDGKQVHGGAAAGTSGRFLPTVYDPEHGLDAQAGRFLLRAWATRAQGDEDRRETLQTELGGTDLQAESLVRWLSGMARLRAARMLMAAQGHG